MTQQATSIGGSATAERTGFSAASAFCAESAYRPRSTRNRTARFSIGRSNVTEHEGPFNALPAWKRGLDIAVILLLLPALMFVLTIVACLIKLVSPGKVLFVQERIGHRGRTFRCLKFRTMHSDNNSDIHREHVTELMSSNKPMKKLDESGDPRIIPFGSILRSSGLDELPQLINVLRGEMSLIGPRPCTRDEYELYEPWQKRRFEAMPGLTGLWQVSGKNDTTFDEMIHLDICYVRNLSLKQDLSILARTVPTLLRQVGGQMEAQKQRKTSPASQAESIISRAV